MIAFSRTIQYSIWLLRRSLEYLINHKKIVRFPTLDKIAADLRWTRPASQHLVSDSFSYWEPCKLTSIFFKVFLFQIITSVIIWTGFKRAAYQFKLGTGQNNLWKEIFIITEKKPIIFGKLYVSNEVDFCHQLYFPLPQIEPKQRALSLF